MFNIMQSKMVFIHVDWTADSSWIKQKLYHSCHQSFALVWLTVSIFTPLCIEMCLDFIGVEWLRMEIICQRCNSLDKTYLSSSASKCSPESRRNFNPFYQLSTFMTHSGFAAFYCTTTCSATIVPRQHSFIFWTELMGLCRCPLQSWETCARPLRTSYWLVKKQQLVRV